MPKILIVDDDEAVRGLLRLRLSDVYQVVETGNPEQALGLALEHKPDAILLDLMMPGFSGFELCQSFHSLSYTSRIPIFVITGEAGTKYKEHCESLGARGYFHKPVDFPALKAALAAELKDKQPERRAGASRWECESGPQGVDRLPAAALRISVFEYNLGLGVAGKIIFLREDRFPYDAESFSIFFSIFCASGAWGSTCRYSL
jgi:CheY-like chemotaxis protein